VATTNTTSGNFRERDTSEPRDAALAEAEALRDAAQAALAKCNARAFSAPPRPIGRSARLLLAPFRRPARLFRGFLVDDIQQKIDHAQRTLETVGETLRSLGETLSAFRSDANRHRVDLAAKIDSHTAGLAARVDSHTASLAARIGSVETRLEELSLRLRTPIEVDDSTVAVRTADGFVLVPRSDTTLLLMLCDAGPQGLEPGTRRLLVSGMTFVDVGAHIGLLTLAGARAVGPRGRVVAFEPTPVTFDLLIRALAISGLGDRVEAQRLACGARPERRAFHVATVLGHSSLLEPAPAGSDRIEIDVVRLDYVLPTGARVDAVKIDVEGAELDVLAGMTRILRENPDLAIIAEFGPAHLRRAEITPDAWFEAFHIHASKLMRLTSSPASVVAFVTRT